MKKILLTAILIFSAMVAQANNDITCMASDVKAFDSGKEDMFVSSKMLSDAQKAGMFKVDFNDPKYTVLLSNENTWIGHEVTPFGTITATMDFKAMVYTKQVIIPQRNQIGFVINKCM